jgi:hypothetical protein
MFHLNNVFNFYSIFIQNTFILLMKNILINNVDLEDYEPRIIPHHTK